MDQTLKQLGELLLGSIPTIIFLVLLYFFYRVLVHAPLAKVLAERLFKAPSTIRTQFEHILGILDVHNRHAAVSFALSAFTLGVVRTDRIFRAKAAGTCA